MCCIAPVELPAEAHAANIKVRIVGQDEAQLWSDYQREGWTHEHPEFEEFVRKAGVMLVARDGSPCFLGRDAMARRARPER